MKSQADSTEIIDYPYIVFRIDKGLYCLNSKNISTIMSLPAYQPLPDAKHCVTGIFVHRDTVIEMFDLRRAFHIPTLNQEYDDFARMLDERKHDHIHWVTELERTLKAGEKFTLATDPHECAFGKWYYQYPFGDDEASRHLRTIEEPHRRLHEAADEVCKCARNCDTCAREECLQDILRRVKEESMPQILGLLDDTKEIFRSTVYHEMALLVEGTGIGIIVDEVVSVEHLTEVREQGTLQVFHISPLICKVQKSARTPELILELDLSTLLQAK